MLVLQRKKGEAINISDDITITVVDICPDCVRIAIDAPRDIRILRSELAEAARANQEAAAMDGNAVEKLKNMLKIQKDKSDS